MTVYFILHKLSDSLCNGKFSQSANPNTPTIWLFNSLMMGLLEEEVLLWLLKAEKNKSKRTDWES